MVDRASGRASWTLDPYQVNMSFAARQRQGQGDSDWFGPLSPIAPAAPADVAGRQWDYPAGYNLTLEPRPYSPVSFATLRQLADGYDLLRLVIETRKDQVARMDWAIKPRGPAKPDSRIDLLTTFSGVQTASMAGRTGSACCWRSCSSSMRRRFTAGATARGA